VNTQSGHTQSGLSVADLTIEYASEAELVSPIQDLSFSGASGTVTLLLGPSGCGKTSLLSAIAGLLSPKTGTIRFGNHCVTDMNATEQAEYRRKIVGIVFQSFNLVPSLRATENVMVPLRADGVARSVARRRANELLETVGLGDRLSHLPGALSGGQLQRVAIARALANDPPLILADEPTASLDGTQVGVVIELFKSIAARGHTVVVATHDQRLCSVSDLTIDLS
jgi:putative ABC transport system ATP-binding protein